MFDHIRFNVADYAKSVEFYDRALLPLGLTRVFEIDQGKGKRAAYGAKFPRFWIAEGPERTSSIHLAFIADSRVAVESFHREAIAAGGLDNGAAGFRSVLPGYFAAYVIDPDGNNIEAVFHDQNIRL